MADIEPVLRSPPVWKSDPEPSTGLPTSGIVGSPDDSAAILELIGGDGENQARTMRPAGDAERMPDIIDELHAQYWRALSDPHALLTSSSIGQSDEPPAHAVPSDTRDEWEPQGHSAGSRSIEALLSGERKLEDVFGRLEGSSDPLLDEAPTPEILRLFAPPEYRAAAARRAPALPPVLTRREHHALSADSPLAAPSRESNS